MEHVGLVLGTITVAAVVTLVLGLLIARRHRHFTMRVTFDVERDDATTTRPHHQENQTMTDTPDQPAPPPPPPPPPPDPDTDDDEQDGGEDADTET